MLLKKLIKNLPKNIKNIKIKGLSLDSRKVKKGDLFFAIKGKEFNGNFFIKDAISKGAAAVVCSQSLKKKSTKTPLIIVKDPKLLLSRACGIFFKRKPKNIFAVTGTNGKSSVADFFHQILNINKIPVATIGTLGIKKNRAIKKLNLTSPDIVTIHKELFNLKKSGIDYVVLEASSHGLAQGRLNEIDFKAGIFTNFSQDHLDYHKNMKNYFNSKMILFSRLLKKRSNMIVDEEIKEFSKLKMIAGKRSLKVIKANRIFDIDKQKISLTGSFQTTNLLMSIAAAKLCGLKKREIDFALNKIKSVDGRLELIRIFPNGSKVYIDFAHTPGALSTVLKSLRKKYSNTISLVFGCGGERDKKKRGEMAKIARRLSDKIYVTDDNPRRESPKKIRKMITQKLKKTNYLEIGNRRKAIKTAIQKSEPEEIILIAGKGHEVTQDYGKKILNISDKSIIKSINFVGKKFTKNNYNQYLNSKILRKIVNKNKNFSFEGVSFNSKEVKKGNLFIAIKGLRNDGHEFVSEAIKKGANFCVVSKNIKVKNKSYLIKCNNTINFLYNLAFSKRSHSKAKVIAVTGSSGKTTVKTLLGKILKVFGDTYYSPKSFNNHYGVPFSLSNLENSHKFGVFEIGMSKKGEINNLSKLVKPNLGIITNIAEAHIENFKNIKEIAKAKGEIINNIDKGGSLILNRDDKFFSFLKNLAENRGVKVLSFGNSTKSDIRLIKVFNYKNYKNLKIRICDESLLLKVRNIETSNIYNILCCMAVLKILYLDFNKIKNFFNYPLSLKGRGKTHKVKRYKTRFNLIDESYNANPLSVKNAIKNLSNIKDKDHKKYVLLGDMLELGNKSDFYHKNLSKIINSSNIDKLFVYGEKALKTYKYISKKKQGNILQDKNDFDDVFSNVIKKDDYLMIKGSNATGLNKISKSIIKGTANVI
ncbi:MAG: UDP-N-acetylmuramoyl-L-alanyl-D-glutamate--2,6-diaminopimelate ligase [Pelagibacterales bacterium MED-G40]|nr:MAG: UDP-N-acetylmuramoyl-L-alanyl-D-glutamate--2,6-diaminopimelate ligase [Candidatus Pelagibacter sp. TMED203]PDH19850.1 MAG: UDP-N-acetylmuramoyl-L-alanyl-D-glutamate--2,6-diaminopimelate ligase [Pelagibacterales bacterium MED-G40]